MTEKLLCCVPMAEELKDHALIHNENSKLYKYMCGRPAKWVVGDWFICEEHKKYMADPNGWMAEPIEEEKVND